MTARVAVAPSVLLWAQERSRREDEAYERKFSAWQEWIAGQKSPTIKQVEELAKYSHLPFGIFFLEEPPKVGSSRSRTTASAGPRVIVDAR